MRPAAADTRISAARNRRISVQLIDARTDRPVWASTYVQDISSVFAWQGEVAQAIAEEISTHVTPKEQARLGRAQPVNAEAQDDYLHGLLLRNAGDCGEAIRYFNMATAKSPDYAQVHSALATCYGMLGESGRMPYQDAFTQQKAEALKAISLDDSLSEAHAELGNAAMTLDRNWPAAAAEFRQALALNSNSATNHEKYAFYLVRVGRPKAAIAQIEQSVALDPVSASTFHAEGFIHYFARQYDQAASVIRTVQGLNVNLSDWNFLLGAIDAAQGSYPRRSRHFSNRGTAPIRSGIWVMCMLAPGRRRLRGRSSRSFRTRCERTAWAGTKLRWSMPVWGRRARRSTGSTTLTACMMWGWFT